MHIEIKSKPKINKSQRICQRLKFKWLERVFNYIKIYVRECGIHGLGYLVRERLTLFERCCWLIIILVSIVCCILIGLESVQRFQKKNVVAGIERDYYVWNTTLPSITVCPFERLNAVAVEEYCRDNHIHGDRKTEFIHFMEVLANSTYLNFGNIPEYPSIDETLDMLHIYSENYMELIYNLTLDNTMEPDDSLRTRGEDGTGFVGTRQVLTEFGLCYMTNNYMRNEYSSRYLIFGEYPTYNRYEHKGRFQKLVRGSFFDEGQTLVFKGFTSKRLAIYVHSAFEVIRIDQSYSVADEGTIIDAGSQDIVVEPNFKNAASVSQRKCRFQSESNLKHYPIYTRNLCIQECRINLAMKLCRCIPHFYPNRVADPKPVCNYRILKHCFPRHETYFSRLYDDVKKDVAKCSCEQSCLDAFVWIKSVSPMNSFSLVKNVLVEMRVNTWPRIRIKRQVIYTLIDLLVSIGGTAGLFLGFSVLGAVEFLYFFTLRLFWHLYGRKI